MKKLKLLASAVALVAASQANATLYTVGGSYIVPTGFGAIPFTTNSGSYDDVAGSGTWNVTADLTGLFAGFLTFDQNFTINAGTGLGTLGLAYNCVGAACVQMTPIFQGALTGTPTPIGAGLNAWSVATGVGPVVFQPTLVAAVPVPAAAWLFGSAVLGLAGIGRRRKMV